MFFKNIESAFYLWHAIHFVTEGNGYPKYGGIGGQGGCIQFEANEKVTLNALAKR